MSLEHMEALIHQHKSEQNKERKMLKNSCSSDPSKPEIETRTMVGQYASTKLTSSDGRVTF